MKNKITAIAFTAVCFIVCLTFFFSQSHSQTKQKYEYKFAFNPNEKEVNKLAAEGWELVTVDAGRTGVTSNVSTFIFKREK